jgi:hypothetical protein
VKAFLLRVPLSRFARTSADEAGLLEGRSASRVYEDSQSALGIGFLACVEAATEEIVRHPLMWAGSMVGFIGVLLNSFPKTSFIRYRAT